MFLLVCQNAKIEHINSYKLVYIIKLPVILFKIWYYILCKSITLLYQPCS